MNELPKLCPVCGAQEISAMPRNPATRVESERQIIAGVLAYRCCEGHVFMVSVPAVRVKAGS